MKTLNTAILFILLLPLENRATEPDVLVGRALIYFFVQSCEEYAGRISDHQKIRFINNYPTSNKSTPTSSTLNDLAEYAFYDYSFQNRVKKTACDINSYDAFDTNPQSTIQEGHNLLSEIKREYTSPKSLFANIQVRPYPERSDAKLLQDILLDDIGSKISLISLIEEEQIKIFDRLRDVEYLKNPPGSLAYASPAYLQELAKKRNSLSPTAAQDLKTQFQTLALMVAGLLKTIPYYRDPFMNAFVNKNIYYFDSPEDVRAKLYPAGAYYAIPRLPPFDKKAFLQRSKNTMDSLQIQVIEPIKQSLLFDLSTHKENLGDLKKKGSFSREYKGELAVSLEILSDPSSSDLTVMEYFRCTGVRDYKEALTAFDTAVTLGTFLVPAKIFLLLKTAKSLDQARKLTALAKAMRASKILTHEIKLKKIADAANLAGIAKSFFRYNIENLPSAKTEAQLCNHALVGKNRIEDLKVRLSSGRCAFIDQTFGFLESIDQHEKLPASIQENVFRNLLVCPRSRGN